MGLVHYTHALDRTFLFVCIGKAWFNELVHGLKSDRAIDSQHQEFYGKKKEEKEDHRKAKRGPALDCTVRLSW